ncbi:hypothetical protein ACFIJ5_14365 [Haloimpatiens sp. FM7330]|uniref:hypothetical protein n=1 Tax=Haloimpatiens sp. FM7330 TaxID=3298610 RepID=UPI00362D496D
MEYLIENIKNKKITYSIEKGAIHIINDDELNDLLKEESAASVKVAKVLLKKYNEQYGDFNATFGSIALEILAHVYPDKIVRVLLNLDLSHVLKAPLNNILSHTDIIDIGENDVERWTLNQLGKFVDLFF